MPIGNNPRLSPVSANLDTVALESVAGLFRALAEPTRLAILQQLRAKPFSVGELVTRLGAKQANVSKQLGLLHGAGILMRERVGNTVYYAISDPLVFELCDLVCGKLKRDAKQMAKLFARTGRLNSKSAAKSQTMPRSKAQTKLKSNIQPTL